MLFAFNVDGELDPRIIETETQEEAEEIADNIQKGIPVREAKPEDMLIER